MTRDPWENRDCERENCPTCITSVENEKVPFKNCTKRSVVYMTWCESCRISSIKESGEKGHMQVEKENTENSELKRKVENKEKKFT